MRLQRLLLKHQPSQLLKKSKLPQLLNLLLKLPQMQLSKTKNLKNPNVKRRSANLKKIRRLVKLCTGPNLKKVKRLKLLVVLLRLQSLLLNPSKLTLNLQLLTNNQLPLQLKSTKRSMLRQKKSQQQNMNPNHTPKLKKKLKHHNQLFKLHLKFNKLHLKFLFCLKCLE